MIYYSLYALFRSVSCSNRDKQSFDKFNCGTEKIYNNYCHDKKIFDQKFF